MTADTLTTRSGIELHVRPATVTDEPALATFFGQVTSEDLRFRFLTAAKASNSAMLQAMIRAEDPDTLSLIVTEADDEAVVATAMLAGDGAGNRAEAAIVLRADCKARGIGYTLLSHLMGEAQARGYAVIECLEDRANQGAISVERDLHFAAQAVPGEPMLVLLSKELR